MPPTNKEAPSKGKLYKTYTRIKTRCENNKAQYYHVYGGKGIKCTWKNFTEFAEDMGASFNQHIEKHGVKQTTIDRIDSNKDYSKSNCRWATYKVQQNNRSYCIYVKIGNETKTVTQWSEIYKINPKTILTRINRGMGAHEAITKPVRKFVFKKRRGKHYQTY